MILLSFFSVPEDLYSLVEFFLTHLNHEIDTASSHALSGMLCIKWNDLVCMQECVTEVTQNHGILETRDPRVR